MTSFLKLPHRVHQSDHGVVDRCRQRQFNLLDGLLVRVILNPDVVLRRRQPASTVRRDNVLGKPREKVVQGDRFTQRRDRWLPVGRIGHVFGGGEQELLERVQLRRIDA